MAPVSGNTKGGDWSLSRFFLGLDQSELKDILYTTDKQDIDSKPGPLKDKTLCRYTRCLAVLLMVVLFLVLCLVASVLGLLMLALKPEAGSPTKPTVDEGPIGVWQLHNSNGSIHINATVPGNVHTALMDAHIIPDPYFRYNDIRLRWVYQDTWTYSYRFNVSENMPHKLHLVCEGLDTIASINVNDVNVGQASNQFLRYIYDITPKVKVGEVNTLSVSFSPPVEYAAQESSSSDIPVPPACPPEEYHLECHPNMIRKSQAAFGSRWSPAVLTQGIWRDIYMVEFSSCRILDVVTQPSKVFMTDTWDLAITTHVDCVAKNDVTLSWTLIDDVTNVTMSADVMLTPGEQQVSQTLKDLRVSAWWPRGHGDQKLYTLNVTLYREGEPPDTKTVTTGFRTVTLVQDPVQNGYSFYFEINGQPIFLKGSTWIPTDSLQGQVNNTRVEGLMKSAVDANMNVLRVPAGGVYETDYFYDLADEYGLMVWQDLMFSSALYPGNDKFMELVRKEVHYQLRRLTHHPSIVAWRGNEHIERAITEKWYGMDGPHYDQYKADYRNLFNKVLRDEVESLTSVPYVLSGPSNGKLTEEEGGISETKDPNSPNYGDFHSERFLQDCIGLGNISTPRFVSEYGWTSWPSYHSLLHVANKEDLVYGSEFFNHREHNPKAANGTDEMITRYFKWTNHLKTEDGFKHYIYLTQLVQALCLRAETEHFRRMRTNGTMGAIWWQHNELWPAPSGATIEQDGTWKMAHYHAALVMADVILTVQREGDIVTGYIVNDRIEDIILNRAQMESYTWSDINPVYGEGLVMGNTIFPRQTVTKAFVLNLITSASYNLCIGNTVVSVDRKGPEWCHLRFCVYGFDKSITIPAVDLYLTAFNQMKGLNPTAITVEWVKKMDDNNFNIQTFCDNSSPFVWAEARDIPGWFSINGVTYDCGSAGQAVVFHSLDPTLTTEKLRQSLTFTSLADIMLEE